MEQNTEFSNVPVYSSPEPQQQTAEMAQAPQAPSAQTSVDQTRALAEVQGAMVIARANPRDENASWMRIRQACKRKSLAERASYAYKRGGQLVTGPSIRLAEVIARSWGNLTYGFREINRTQGQSEIEAYAWDLETNTRVSRQFAVPHRRDKKNGPEELTQERDKYEMVASMAQRRVRACILEIVPGDVVEDAEEQCKKTLESANGEPLEARIRKMLQAFYDNFGVTQAMIEKHLGHKVDAIVDAELVQLKQIYQSIKDGMADRKEFFDLQATGVSETQDQGKKSGGKGKGKEKEQAASRGKGDAPPEQGTEQPAEEPTEGAQPESAIIECPDQDDRPISKQYCNETCEKRQGCPAWE
jgi:hypothetical protein